MTESRRASFRRYRQSEKGKIVRKIANLRYSQSERGKAVRKRVRLKYRKSEKGKAVLRRHVKRKRQMDIGFKIKCNLSRLLIHSLKRQGTSKTGRAIELLDCSIPAFRIYLESLWESGMTWENYGKYGWHIDHVVPCALFDLTNPDHQKRCFHFSNMRPMWAKDNVSRGIRGHHQFRLL